MNQPRVPRSIDRISKWLLLMGVVLGVSACRCKDPPLGGVDGGVTACQSNEDCQASLGSRYLCLDGICCPGARYCDLKGESECCPGQTCSRTEVCVDRYDACETDTDCTVAGQKCLDHAVGGGGPEACGGEVSTTTVCTFERCDVSGACTGDLSCFAGFCVGENPCDGACSGKVCSVSNNRCQAAPPHPSCAISCEPGTLLAFEDPDNIDDACDTNTVTCACFALPPLDARDIGRHSALALLSDGSALVSAFEGDHGDLVVVAFAADGTRQETTWIDGLPVGGTPVADPSGPRGGIADPGPEVGRYTDIAIASDDTVHISYYDVDSGALRYARRSAGTWSVHVVDALGDVGRYSAIALDGTGVPVIAYYQAAGDSDALQTGLKVARARSATPGAATDWDLVTVATGNAPAPPCPAGCAAGERCADLGAGPTCLTERNDCATPCGSGEVCIDDGAGTPRCSAELVPSAIDDLPMGLGLFPALWVTSAGGVTVAYHDRLAGTLELAVGIDPASGNAGSHSTIEGGGGNVVGLFPAIALQPGGDYLIVHRDDSANQVLWSQVTAAGVRTDGGVVDDGLRDPAGNGVSFVGADNALILDGDRALVAYHDGTAGDLVLSTRAIDGSWTRRELEATGSAGFWTDAALASGKLKVSHATLLGARTGPIFTDLQLLITTP